MSNEMKAFPIQGACGKWDESGELIVEKRSSVPWWLAEEAYKVYARRFGTSQSLERLAERGGFGRNELLMLLRDDDRL